MPHDLRRRSTATATLLLVAGAATVVLAQNQSETTSWRIPGWSFTPGVTLSGIFDSNVALASAPADTRTTQSDQVFIMEPFGSLDYVSRRTEFSGGYRGFVRRYMDVGQLNGFTQRGSLSVRHLASRHLSFYVQDTYSHVPTTDEVELNGVPFTRTGSRTNSVAGGVDAQLTKFTSLSARYDLMWVSFDRQDTFLTGGFVNGVRTELTHHFNRRTRLGAEYGIRLADLNEGTRQITFQDAGATVSYGLGPHTSLNLAGGLSHLADHATGDSRTGPYIRAEVTREAERATLGASYERRYVPSFGFGGSNQSQQVRGVVRIPFPRSRLYVNSSAAWRRRAPPNWRQCRPPGWTWGKCGRWMKSSPGKKCSLPPPASPTVCCWRA